jgi:hypothetical protein
MGNLFDGLQVGVHTIVGKTMGYTATWAPSAGGPTQTAVVLFNEPTQKAEITDEDFEDIATKMEFLQGDFVGLVESVRNNGVETIIISGVSYLTYGKVRQKFDGKTIIINLQPSE